MNLNIYRVSPKMSNYTNHHIQHFKQQQQQNLLPFLIFHRHQVGEEPSREWLRRRRRWAKPATQLPRVHPPHTSANSPIWSSVTTRSRSNSFCLTHPTRSHSAPTPPPPTHHHHSWNCYHYSYDRTSSSSSLHCSLPTRPESGPNSPARTRPSGLKQLASRKPPAWSSRNPSPPLCPHTHYNHHNHHHGDPDSIPGRPVKFLKFRRNPSPKKKEEEEEEVGSGRQKALQRNEGSEAKWGFLYLFIYIYKHSLRYYYRKR